MFRQHDVVRIDDGNRLGCHKMEQTVGNFIRAAVLAGLIPANVESISIFPFERAVILFRTIIDEVYQWFDV